MTKWFLLVLALVLVGTWPVRADSTQEQIQGLYAQIAAAYEKADVADVVKIMGDDFVASFGFGELHRDEIAKRLSAEFARTRVVSMQVVIRRFDATDHDVAVDVRIVTQRATPPTSSDFETVTTLSHHQWASTPAGWRWTQARVVRGRGENPDPLVF